MIRRQSVFLRSIDSVKLAEGRRRTSQPVTNSGLILTWIFHQMIIHNIFRALDHSGQCKL